MSQVKMRHRTIVLLTMTSVIALFAAGCSCSQKVESLQQENRDLSRRVAQLESQLQQMEVVMSAPAPAPAVQPQINQSVYIVNEGDTLWNIAKKRLGNGNRYKEILALNPGITKDKPLAVGTRLIIPSR